jgi:hypothetical protein
MQVNDSVDLGSHNKNSAAYFIGCMFSGGPYTPTRLDIFFDPRSSANVDQASLRAMDLVLAA